MVKVKKLMLIIFGIIIALAITALLCFNLVISPYMCDIYLSKSLDGINLTYPEGPILLDRAVPTGAYFDDGWIRLYTDDGIILRFINMIKTEDNHFVRGIAVMKSKDGVHFQKEKMKLDTFPINHAVMTDPELIKTKEGFWRLYLTVWEQGKQGLIKPLYTLTSDDGINWKYEGKAIDYQCEDPTVLFIEKKDHYILYCPSGRDKSLIAISSDGKKFGQLMDYNLPAVHAAAKVGENYLLYYELPKLLENGIAITKDGLKITKMINLTIPLNEPTIIKNPDGEIYFYSSFPRIYQQNINK